jgi:hypothetical protein
MEECILCIFVFWLSRQDESTLHLTTFEVVFSLVWGLEPHPKHLVVETFKRCPRSLVY